MSHSQMGLVQKWSTEATGIRKAGDSNSRQWRINQRVRSSQRMKLVLVLIILCWATPAFAASWSVRQSCVHNGNGTASSCAKSPGAPGAWGGFSNIVWGSISPGDKLNLISGETYSPPLNVGASGSAGNPITITVTGGRTATIDMNNIAGLVGVNFLGHEYVTLDGVIGNRVAGDSIYGLKIINIASTGITKSFCVYNNAATGEHNKVLHVECSGSSQAQPDDTTSGMFINRCLWEIAYNWVHSSAIPSLWWGTGISHLCGPTSPSTNYDNDTLHHNQVEYMNDDGIRCASNCSVYNNVLRHIDGAGGSHADALLIQSGSYSAVYNNYVENSGGQNIYIDNLYDSTCGHIRIYNNVINSNPGFGIVIDAEGGAGPAPAASGCTGSRASKWDHLVIANNTVYSTSASSIRTSGRGQSTNLVILNNIFGTNSDVSFRSLNLQSNTTFASDTSWDYNVYSTASAGYPTVAAIAPPSYSTLAQLQALSLARETNGMAGVPTYVNPEAANFHLASGDMIARGTGVNLTSTYPFLTADKDGAQRPLTGPWSVGAYEGVSGSTLSPPLAAPSNLSIR